MRINVISHLILSFFVILVFLGFLLTPETFAKEFLYSLEFVKSMGTGGSGDGEFRNPFGIAFDSKGNLYVGDNGNKRIQKFDSSGSYLKSWGSKGTGEGQFLNLYGMAFDSKDYLYVIDGGSNDRVQKFASDGAFVKQWKIQLSSDEPSLQPIDIAIDSQDLIYVLEGTKNRVQVFDPEGNPLKNWGSTGSKDGKFKDPRGIAIDSSDYVYIVEYGNNRVQKFDTSGSFIEKWGPFSQPFGIVIDSGGNVYISDSERIQMFASDGSFKTQLGSLGKGTNQFDGPRSLAVDSSDRLFVVDGGNNRISVFSQKEIPNPDIDEDGVDNLEDNCPEIPNDAQEDENNNGVGDMCDPKVDSDNDGVNNEIDNCLFDYNPDQEDSDNDGKGDHCESPRMGISDTDEDGYEDWEDKCPLTPNPGNKDSDDDGIGDACDIAPDDETKWRYENHFNFELELAPVIETQLGKNTTTIININTKKQDQGKVILSYKCPNDIICKFSKTEIIPSDSSELTVYTNDSTREEYHPISIIAIGGGQKETQSYQLEVYEPENIKPEAKISSIPPSEVNQKITFNGTESEDQDGKIIVYSWDFGDGSPKVEGNKPKVTHTYEKDGPYTVTLTVTDNADATGTDELDITISPVWGLSNETLLAAIIGIIGIAGTIAGVLISMKKREGKKPKRKDIPDPKESKLK